MVAFQDKPECREAVIALAADGGFSNKAVVECVRDLYQQHGGDEAWTTIKAQGYKRVREMLDNRRAKRAKLMGPPDDGVKNDPTAEQLAEAEKVLCIPFEVSPEYVQRTVTSIFQSYGGQQGAWDLMKENGWDAVVNFILTDPKRTQDGLDAGGSGAANGVSGQPVEAWTGASPPRHHHSSSTPLPAVHATQSESPLQRPLVNLQNPSSSHSPVNVAPPKGLHSPSMLQNPSQILTPEQRALIEEVDEKAAVLALPQNLPPGPLPETLSPRGVQPARLYGPSFPPPSSQTRPNGFAAARLAGKSKAGTQLLEPSDSPRNRAWLVRKSQEATEEAQKKRRLERERHAGLCSKAGLSQRGIPEGLRHCELPPATEHAAANGAVGGQEDEGGSGSFLHDVADVAQQMGAGPGVGGALVRPGIPPEQNRASKLTALQRKLNGDRPRDSPGSARGPHRMDGHPSTGIHPTIDTEATAGYAHDLWREVRLPVRGEALTDGKEKTQKECGKKVYRRTKEPSLEAGDYRVDWAGAASQENGARMLRFEEGGNVRSEDTQQEGEETLPRPLKRLRKIGDTPEKQRGPGKMEAPGIGGGKPSRWGPSCDDIDRPVKAKKSLHELLEKLIMEDGSGLVETSAPRRVSCGDSAEQDLAVDEERECVGSESKAEQEHGGGEAKGCGSATERDPPRSGEERIVSEDLSRGMERFEIRCVNRYTDDELPKSFRYMKESKPFDVARKYIPYLSRLADDEQCACERDCLAGKLPCGCSNATRGTYAYDTDGRLQSAFLAKQMNEPNLICPGVCFTEKWKLTAEARLVGEVPPCKGHRRSDFIKECSVRCTCHVSCGNRVVQRGIAVPLEVHWMRGKGWGVVSREALPAGTFVCEYVGEILTTDELEERNKEGDHKHHYPVTLDADPATEDLVDNESGLCLDGTNLGNVARFINHRCGDATLIDIPVEIEGPDHNFYHIAFFTTRHVEAGTELTWDYCIDFDDVNHPIKAFRCKCGSSKCRGASLKT